MVKFLVAKILIYQRNSESYCIIFKWTLSINPSVSGVKPRHAQFYSNRSDSHDYLQSRFLDWGRVQAQAQDNWIVLIVTTVPVEAAYQVWRVPKVLSMGKVCTYVQGVTEKSCQIKPWENFEKMQFLFFQCKQDHKWSLDAISRPRFLDFVLRTLD